MIEPFLSAVPLLEKLQENGFEAYFVGGSVRDYLMKREITDIDIATSATPAEIKQIFKKTIDVGIEHGTVLVLHNRNQYEITTFRTGTPYKDMNNNKRSKLKIDDDLKYRDFTMNAIAMTSKGEIIDPFNGQLSLERREIVAVRNAEERFYEDGLRMLRAIRFVSQLNFTLEEETKLTIEKNRHLLSLISIERIAVEFEKILLGTNVKEAINLLVETKLYEYLRGFENEKNSLIQLQNYDLTNFTIEERWVLLLYISKYDEKGLNKLLESWKLSKSKRALIKKLLQVVKERLESEWTYLMLYNIERENIVKVERLYSTINSKSDFSDEDILEMYDKLPIHNRDEIALNGHDLMRILNRKGGPWLNELFFQMEVDILNGSLNNNKSELENWLKLKAEI